MFRQRMVSSCSVSYLVLIISCTQTIIIAVCSIATVKCSQDIVSTSSSTMYVCHSIFGKNSMRGECSLTYGDPYVRRLDCILFNPLLPMQPQPPRQTLTLRVILRVINA